MKHYAGIGSRQTPEPIQKVMTNIASKLEEKDWVLRSGGADGADTAFELGVSNRKKMEIYLPDFYFNGRTELIPGCINIMSLITYDAAMKTVSQFHPAPNRLSPFAQRLMARNAMQVLGSDLKTPSRMIICWTSDGKSSGGTGQALRIAEHYKIPVFNLGNQKVLHSINKYLDTLETGRQGAFGFA